MIDTLSREYRPSDFRINFNAGKDGVSHGRTQFADAQFERALKFSLESFPHIRGLNEEQICCLQSVAIKLDVFGIVPTGFGKV